MQLWEERDDGRVVWLAPHGQCCFCEGWFHTDAMHSYVVHNEPIRLLGGWCLTCFKLPLPVGDPLRDIKLIG